MAGLRLPGSGGSKQHVAYIMNWLRRMRFQVMRLALFHCWPARALWQEMLKMLGPHPNAQGGGAIT
eukprot:6931018-Pyramimonas_sp.AAC.1